MTPDNQSFKSFEDFDSEFGGKTEEDESFEVGTKNYQKFKTLKTQDEEECTSF